MYYIILHLKFGYFKPGIGTAIQATISNRVSNTVIHRMLLYCCNVAITVNILKEKELKDNTLKEVSKEIPTQFFFVKLLEINLLLMTARSFFGSQWYMLTYLRTYSQVTLKEINL